MAPSTLDPLRVPEGFWLRDNIGNALDHRASMPCSGS